MNGSGWKAAGHRIIVKVAEFEEKTESGIVIATGESAKREQLGMDAGEIVEMGPTCFNDQSEPWCKVGDYISFARYAGKLLDGSPDYRIINDLDVVAVKESK